ncbi:hypothetical protein GCM10007389_12830 [Pontibacter akesuensis]|nr:hypothetical protein GCM10007389_12830 [Pontibacter akesuensis]
MKLLEGEKILLITPKQELILTNLRVSQKTSDIPPTYGNHVFLKQVYGCEVVHRRNASWVVGMATALTLAPVSLLLN